MSIDMCVKFLVQLSNKIVGLDLAPFSRKVENHHFRVTNTCKTKLQKAYF